MFSRCRILTRTQLKRLSDHKYSSSSSSILDPLLQVWWNYLVGKLPLWLAPNLITITGLFVNISTSLVLVWYSPDAKTEVPGWSCLLCAAGLFVYQSLDAIDGKQARITRSSSPLGELFDHGCDAVSTVFLLLSAVLVVRLGFFPHLMYLVCFTGFVCFYCAHWKTYVTGTLRFGKFDATEAQTSIMMIHVLSAIFGPEIWMINVPYIDLPLILILGVITFILSSLVVVKSVLVICNRGAGKNGSTVAGTSVLSPGIPLSIAVIPGYVIYWKSLEGVYENNPAIYILAFGLVCAKVTILLVIAHMTKKEIDYLDSTLLGPALLFFNQYFDFFVPEHVVLWLCLAWVVIDLVSFSWQACVEICDHLDIRLFHIPVTDSPRRGPSGATWLPTTRFKAKIT